MILSQPLCAIGIVLGRILEEKLIIIDMTHTKAICFEATEAVMEAAAEAENGWPALLREGEKSDE